MTRHTKIRATLLAVLAFTAAIVGVAALPGAAAANSDDVIVVDDNGGNNVDSESISAALVNASSGDVIEVREGTYEETFQIRTRNVTLRGEEGTEIEAPATTGEDRIVDIRARDVTVTGFTITGVGRDSAPSGIFIGGEAAQNANISDNTIQDVLTGVQTASSAWGSGALIENNDVSDVGVGISIQSNDTVVEDNTITNANLGGIGIIAGGSDGYAVRTNNTVENNNVETSGGVPEASFHFGSPGELNGISGAEYEVVNALMANNSGVEAVEIKSTGETYDGSIENVDTGTVYATIQQAVDAAEDGDTIEVEPGTYDGPVTVETTNVTVEGPNAGTPGYANRTPEANITGQVVVNASNVVFDGFTVSPPQATTNPGGEALRVSGTPDDVVVQNNIVEGFSGDDLPEGEGIDGLVAFGGDDWTPITNVTITQNKVQNIEGDSTGGGVAGISIQGNVDGADVTDNVVTEVGMNDTAWAFGLVVRGTDNHKKVPQNVVLTGNDVHSIHSNPTTDTVGVGLGVESNDASEVEAHNNDIWDVELLAQNKDSAHTLNATSNWWGDANGPDAADNPLTTSAAGIVGDVDFMPWLDAPTDSNGTPTGPVENVDQSEYYLTIQAAVDAVNPGDTVTVAPGNYTERVAVNESMTLVGSGGPDAGDGNRSVINSSDGPVVEVNAADVTVSGFVVTGAEGKKEAGQGVDVNGKEHDTDDVRLTDLVVKENDDRGLALGHTDNATIENVVVRDNFDPENDGDTPEDGGESTDDADGITLWYTNNSQVVDVRAVNNSDNGVYAKGNDNYFENVTAINNGDEGLDISSESVTGGAEVVGLNATDNNAEAVEIAGNGAGANVSIENAFLAGSPRGLFVRGNNEGPVTIQDGEFENNTVQVLDDSESMDVQSVIENTNTFDPFVTVRDTDDSGELLDSIWGEIQPAVDAAGSGDTVTVGSGTYEENVVIDSSVTLDGAGAGQTVIAPESGRPISVENVTNGNRIKIDEVAVRNLSIVAPDQNQVGLIAVSNLGDDDNETGTLTVRNVVAEGGLAPFGLFDTERATFDNVTARDVESDVGAFEVGGVGNLTITDSRIENTTTGVKFNDFTDLGYQVSGSLTITGTTFDRNDVHVDVTAGIDATDVTLRENEFLADGQSSSTALAVDNDGEGAVDAKRNYWGSDDGPSGAAPNDGAAISEGVNHRPWLLDNGQVNDDPETFYVNATASAPANGSQEAPFPTIEDALDASIPGDKIVLQNGTYDRSSTLTVSQNDTTIVGESRDGVVINTSGVPDYGIATPDDGNVTDVVFENLTVVGPQQGLDSNYALKFNPTTDGVFIRNVTVTDSHRTGIDFNGVRNVSIEDVTVSNTTSGNGMAFADTRHVLVDDVTVENNSWGGIALYTNDHAHQEGLENGTHDVTIRNSEFVNNSGIGLYAQNTNRADNPFENIVVVDNEFRGNDVHVAEKTHPDTNVIKSSGDDWFDFQEVFDANDFDNGVIVGNATSVTVPAVFSTIQHGVDAADSGEFVEVASGTYDEFIRMKADNVTLQGEDGAVINVSEDTMADNSRNRVIDTDFQQNVTIDGLEVVGFDRSGNVAGIYVNAGENVTLSNNTVRNIPFGLQTSSGGSAGAVIRDNKVEGVGVTGISVLSNDTVVSDNTVTDSDERGIGVLNGREEVEILRNEFTDIDGALVKVRGIPSYGTGGNVTVAENNLSSGEYGVDNQGVGTHVDAQSNWWGSRKEPVDRVNGSVDYRPWYVDEEMTELSSEPPQVADVTLTDLTDDNGFVGDGDEVEISATVTDAIGVNTVTVDAGPLGAGTVTLADPDGDDTYTATFTVDAPNATAPDGGVTLSMSATDEGGNTAQGRASITLATDSTTATTFGLSDATPLNVDVVDVDVTVENVGERQAERTVTLIVDGSDVATREVTLAPDENRTVTFQHRFSTGEHAVTVNDGNVTLAAKTVTAERATNPNAEVTITSPNASETFSGSTVSVGYDLTDADEGIAAVAYAVDDGPQQNVTDLDRTSVTLTGLSDGEHTVDVWLVDNLGNDLATDSVTFDVDSTKPVVTIAPAHADAISANRPVDVTLAVEEENPGTATFEVHDDTGTVVYSEDVSDELVDGTHTLTWDGTNGTGHALATGNYDLVLIATDAGGLSNETVETVSVDSTPPSVDSITPNTTALGSGDSVTVDVTASDSDTDVREVTVTLVAEDVNYRTTVEAENASGTWTAEFDAANLSVDGDYSVVATATDVANNEGTNSNGNALDVDTTAPSVSAIVDKKNATHGYVNVTVPDDEVSASEIGLSLTDPDDDPVDVSDLSAVSGTNTYSGTFSFGDSGEYSLAANATDDVGNLGETSANATINTTLGGNEGEEISITGGDGTQVVLTLNGSVSNQFAAFTTSDTPLAELGTNVGSTFLNGELSQDLSDNIANATIRIPVEGNVPDGVDESDVNISRYNPQNVTWEEFNTTIETDADGTEYFVTTVEHFSTYGPVAPDTTAPTIDDTSLSPTATGQYDYDTSTVDVTVEYSDNKQVNASNVTVLWNDTDVTDDPETSVSASGVTFTATDLVGSGDHDVTVRVTDTANNTNSTTVEFTVEQDTAGPTVDLVEDSFDFGTDPVGLEFTYSDAPSGVDTGSVELTVDGRDRTGPAIVTASGVQYDAAGLASGSHTVTLNVSDGEGNWENVTETFTIARDNDDPTVTATALSPTPTDGVLPVGTSQVTVDLTYSDATSAIDASAVEVTFDGEDVTDEAAITTTGLTYTAVGLENGTTYTLSADVPDAEGNVVTETVTFEVDAPSSDDPPSPSDRSERSTGLSSTIRDGTATIDLGRDVSRLGITFADENAAGTVSVRSLDARPDAVAPVPDATAVAFLDVSVPSFLTGSEATLRLTVDADAIGDASPDSLVVYHHENGEWRALETTVVSSSDGETVLEATTPGFSLFAVGSVQQEETTTETTQPDDGTETTTTQPEDGTTQPEDAGPTQEPAGFDPLTVLVVLLVVAAAVAAYVVRTRRV